MYYLKQCILEKENKKTTAYIPEKFANLNKLIKIDELEGSWKIIEVSDQRKTSHEMNIISQNYKRTRKTSDI
jgi:hypothetical protein